MTRPSQRSSTLGLPSLTGTQNPFTESPAFASNPNTLERGVILSVDADGHTYRVLTSSGREQYMARIRSHPGDLALLPVQTQVLVTYGLGAPFILGMIPDPGRTTGNTEPESITGTAGHGGEDPMLARSVAPSARMADEPRDQVPGDAVLRSPDGSSLGALRGRVAQLKGSDLAKIEAFGGSDLVRLVAGAFQMITWMGESRVINEDGKTSLIWDGGSDQLTQTGQDESQYTMHLRLGHAGNLVRFTVTNREGQTKFGATVAPDGSVDIFSQGDMRAQYGRNADDRHNETFIGTHTEEVVGSRSTTVEGDLHTTVNGAITQEFNGSANCYVGGDLFCQTTQSSRTTVGGDATTVATGGYSVFTEGNLVQEVLGGGFYDVKTTGGAIKFGTRGGLCQIRTGAGNFEVASRQIKLQAGANSILLGENPTSHATKFEELNLLLQGLMQQVNAMRQLIATHVHPITAPATTGPAPSLAPIAATITLSLEPAQSRTTLVD